MLLSVDAIRDILVCPRCHAPLASESPFRCTGNACDLAATPFLVAAGQPALVDFDRSIIDRDTFVQRGGASVQRRDPTRAMLRTKIKRFFLSENEIAKKIVRRFRDELLLQSPSPVVLVIGGGERGSAVESLYDDPRIGVIGTDIYASPNTTLVADGDDLPFADGSVDGVWIEAVLEHVLDPWRVVAEIHRVLKPRGLVVADSPFMQPVHEGAYDFTRFSVSGHRWLFRNFETVLAGVSYGPPYALNLSTRYFVQGIARSQKVGTLTSIALFWLGPFEKLMGPRWKADGAAGADHAKTNPRVLRRPAVDARWDVRKRELTYVNRRMRQTDVRLVRHWGRIGPKSNTSVSAVA